MSAEATAAMRAFAPEWALVLGSGLGSLVDRVEVAGREPYSTFPDLAVGLAPGHAGEWVWGHLAGARVLLACGRVHLYEARKAKEVTAGVRFIAGLGIHRLILTNAAGSLHDLHPPGSWMMLTDHLNLTGTSPLLGGPNFVSMEGIYSAALRERFARAAAEVQVPLCTGVYAGVLGPQYETPAEVRMLRALGADAVGMSTVLEAIQARALGLEVAGFSCLTNWAAGLGTEELSHEGVLSAGREAAAAFTRILEAALRSGGA